ncbi:MAG: tRNA (adenosine(37)-N6)-threonylcarbamoyltransferase complex dimerization subunit type 1 TsaB [Actinobacteria bacterium]|nr:tRNA (adenosine(37)-N6)-threonylcarbamoyltransferase complex dimerization subunit type 1 TsaB [Actinomycetota bacterium]
MRPFLAFDTATDYLALGVGDLDAPDRVIAAVDFTAPRAANAVVLLAVERLLAGAGVSADALCAVAVGRGPGSFTGVRIGVATAKGLTHGLRVPLVGFGTLDAIALRAGEDGLVGVVGDAMRGEVYPALFRSEGDRVERVSPDRVASPSDVAAEWAALGEPISLTGAGLAKHAVVLETTLGSSAVVVEKRRWVPTGEALVAAAWAATGDRTLASVAALDRAAAYETAHPQSMLPIYTRLADAEEAERRAGRHMPPGGVVGPEATR